MGLNTILNKHVCGNGVDFYCFLVDYDQMALPWPDGYQNSEDRIAGQAPIGVNDNYMFYCVNGEYRQLMFGQCEEVYRPIDDTVAFNRIMEPVAIQNEKMEQSYESIAILVKLLENMARMKHGDQPFSNDPVMQQKTSLTVVSLFEQFFSKLAANGIRYTVEQMGQEPNPGIHFPVKFYMTRNGRPVTLERILEDLIA